MAWPLQPSGPTVRLAMMTATFPHPPAVLPPQPASQPLPVSSPFPSQVRAFWLGMGGAPEREASFPLLPTPLYPSLVRAPSSPPFPSWAWILFLPCYQNKQTEIVVSWKYYYRIQATILEIYIKSKKKCGITSFLQDFTQWPFRIYLGAILNL